MFAYGVFFDRFSEEKLDYTVTEKDVDDILADEKDNVLGKSITAFVLETAIRNEFRTKEELVQRASQYPAGILLDEEEHLIALAGTREAARKAFVLAYSDEPDFE